MATTYKASKAPRMRSVHPGEILREEVLPALGISVTQAARDLGISRQTLHRVLREEGGITPDLAVRLGKLCGNGARLWLRMQASYDLAEAERRLAKTVARIPTRSAAA